MSQPVEMLEKMRELAKQDYFIPNLIKIVAEHSAGMIREGVSVETVKEIDKSMLMALGCWIKDCVLEACFDPAFAESLRKSEEANNG